jgi:cyclomaltodextrinase / maltogenic alpha-amylase / neopullulanase
MKTLRLSGNFCLALACVLIMACRQQPARDYTDRSLILGLASPISLAGDSTRVNLEDYVINLADVDSVSVSPPLTASFDGKYLLLRGAMIDHLGSISVWRENQAYAIPLQKASKTTVTLTYSGNASEVKTKGEFNAWNADQTIFAKESNVFTATLALSPGRYQYVLVVDGKERRDPANKDSVDNGLGGWNSLLTLPKPDVNKLPLISTNSHNQSSIQLALSNPADQVQVYWENFLLDEVSINNNAITITLPPAARQKKRSFVRAWAANREGISNDVLIPLENGKVVQQASELTRTDKEAQVLYFMMVDRFNNASTTNDQPVPDKSIHPKANYFGGDIQGITAKINDGYFDSLGINTLWLSPITQNPKGAFGKYPTPPTTFSGYHGYWPVSLKHIDSRYGTAEDLRALLSTAHARNINVILDYVAHHVHQEHPLFKQKPEWFTSLYLPDGTINTERWDDQRLTTWFDVFLPTLDLRKPEVVGPMTDTAMFWLQQYDLDGFRHDASKHIDLLFWRELTKKVKSQIIQGQQRLVYQIGETYGSRELVNSYVNSGMLDGQFDFNLYDDAVATFAREDVPFSRLVNSLQESITYFGDHHLMGNVTGNQDRARFISYADGSVRFDEDAKRAGWTRTITVKDTTAYNKLQLLTAFMMSVPGVPVIYYGDEIGDPGGNDPDNRRMMRFENLRELEKRTRSVTQQLVSLRRSNLALLYGDCRVTMTGDEHLVITRQYFNTKAVILFNKSGKTATLSAGAMPTGSTVHFGSGSRLEGSDLTVTLKPYSFDIITSDL